MNRRGGRRNRLAHTPQQIRNLTDLDLRRSVGLAMVSILLSVLPFRINRDFRGVRKDRIARNLKPLHGVKSAALADLNPVFLTAVCFGHLGDVDRRIKLGHPTGTRLPRVPLWPFSEQVDPDRLAFFADVEIAEQVGVRRRRLAGLNRRRRRRGRWRHRRSLFGFVFLRSQR